MRIKTSELVIVLVLAIAMVIGVGAATLAFNICVVADNVVPVTVDNQK